MDMILIVARAYSDGGPNDRGWIKGHYWLPENLTPIPWGFDMTDEETAERIRIIDESQEYIQREYGVNVTYCDLNLVPDPDKLIQEWIDESHRVDALLDDARRNRPHLVTDRG